MEPKALNGVATPMEAYIVISLGIGGVLALMFGPGIAAFLTERRRMRGS